MATVAIRGGRGLRVMGCPGGKARRQGRCADELPCQCPTLTHTLDCLPLCLLLGTEFLGGLKVEKRRTKIYSADLGILLVGW